jgi:hypothetical protein
MPSLSSGGREMLLASILDQTGRIFPAGTVNGSRKTEVPGVGRHRSSRKRALEGNRQLLTGMSVRGPLRRRHRSCVPCTAANTLYLTAGAAAPT